MSKAIPLMITATVLFEVSVWLDYLAVLMGEKGIEVAGLAYLLSLPTLALFVTAIVFTSLEENKRHEQNESGLGPAGLCAVICCVPIFIITMVLKIVLTNKRLKNML